MATAVAIVIILVAAIANAGEFCTASGANNVAGIDVFVEADGVMTSRALNFDEIVVAAAIAVIIVTVAAVAIFVDLVVILFKSAEVFVDLFDVGFEIFGVFLKTGDSVCNVAENIENCGNYLIVTVKTFCETLDISNFFRNVHDFEPLYHTERA